jgi:fatty-acyl-CoA synthase
MLKNDKAVRVAEETPYRDDREGLNFAQVLDAQAEQRPDKVWLVHGDESMTFGEFSEATDHLAVALRKEGLQPGETCALWYPNSIRYILFQFAILKAGAIIVPLNTRYRAHELSFMLNFGETRFLFTVSRFLKADFAEILKGIVPSIPKLTHIYMDVQESMTSPDGVRDMNELLKYRAGRKEIKELRQSAVKDTEPASILFTSGTTSQPKAVLSSHLARVWTGIRNAERMRIMENDVLLNPLPFCHEFGGFTIPSHAILGGCRMVIMEVFNAEEALRLIDEHKISVLYGVPTMFTYMLSSPDFRKYDLSSLRTGYMSGATCPLELVKAVQEDMRCNISVAYGLSEIPCHTISEYDDPPEIKATTIGKPVRDATAKIVDDKRQEMSLGTPGEIALKGKNMMIGYYKNSALTLKTIDEEGFLYTSDLGLMDSKGYVHFLGRKSDMIVAGGFNIYPLEVEEVLYELPYVELTAVVGLPSEMEEIVVACIVLREGTKATKQEIIDYCRGRLANYKVPKRVEFMETFPTTLATNKIKKSELIEILKEA